jgi:folate-dependent phosphoribosylglycinamide formyltransferase PurN
MVTKTIGIVTSLPDLGIYLIKMLCITQNVEFVVYQKAPKNYFKIVIVKLIDLYSTLYSFCYYKKTLREYKVLEQIFSISNLRKICKKYKIELIITRDINRDRKVLEKLQSSESEINFVLGGKILSNKLLKTKNIDWINAHGGILPHYGGLCSEYWAINNGDYDNIGHSFHFISSKLDSGNILYKGYTSVKSNDQIFKIEKRNHLAMIVNYIKFIEELPLVRLKTPDTSNVTLYKCPKRYLLRKYKLVSYDK